MQLRLWYSCLRMPPQALSADPSVVLISWDSVMSTTRKLIVHVCLQEYAVNGSGSEYSFGCGTHFYFEHSYNRPHDGITKASHGSSRGSSGDLSAVPAVLLISPDTSPGSRGGIRSTCEYPLVRATSVTPPRKGAKHQQWRPAYPMVHDPTARSVPFIFIASQIAH